MAAWKSEHPCIFWDPLPFWFLGDLWVKHRLWTLKIQYQIFVAFDPCPLSLWKCCSLYNFSMRMNVNPSCLWNQTTENKHIKSTSNGLPCRHIGFYLLLSWKKKIGQFEASWVTCVNLGKIWRDISCYDNFGRDHFKTWISTEGRELTADDYETLLQLDSAGPSVSSDDQAVEAGATLIWFVSWNLVINFKNKQQVYKMGRFCQL